MRAIKLSPKRHRVNSYCLQIGAVGIYSVPPNQIQMPRNRKGKLTGQRLAAQAELPGVIHLAQYQSLQFQDYIRQVINAMALGIAPLLELPPDKAQAAIVQRGGYKRLFEEAVGGHMDAANKPPPGDHRHSLTYSELARQQGWVSYIHLAGSLINSHIR